MEKPFAFYGTPVANQAAKAASGAESHLRAKCFRHENSFRNHKKYNDKKSFNFR